MKKKFVVPIYEADVWLVVSDNVHRERVKMNHLFGLAPDEYSYSALSCHDGAGTFGLFFEPKHTKTSIVAHEVFHLTHRILEWTSSNFDTKHHEQGAMLNGFLMHHIMKETKKYRKQHKLE